MQAVISRSGRVGKIPFAVFALAAGLTLGGVGGYSISSVLRPSLITSGASPVRSSISGNDLAISAARHAATEHDEALDGTDLAASMARHADSERADAGDGNGVSP
jgi:hypothetical protein